MNPDDIKYPSGKPAFIRRAKGMPLEEYAKVCIECLKAIN